MWELRILDLDKNTIFEKTLPTNEYLKFKRKCNYSKKLRIISEMKVW